MKPVFHISAKYPFLDPDELFEKEGDPENHAVKGRGRVAYLSLGTHRFVRKRYMRGGWMRKISRDRYAYFGLRFTRMAREFALLEKLKGIGLPVPEPVAYRCMRQGPFAYQGHLVTHRLEDAETLGSTLRRTPLPSRTWKLLGATLGRFHRHGVHHADLNVENILLRPDGEIMLIDFDKGMILKPLARFWAHHNLRRLKRSLLKQASRSAVFHLSKENWTTLSEAHGLAFKGIQGRSGALQSRKQAVAGSD